MSGGSYEYLCYKMADDMLRSDAQDQLEKMIERLVELRRPEVAKELEQYLLFLRSIWMRITARQERLYDVMHAVEWLDSGDYGKESFDTAIERWQEKY